MEGGLLLLFLGLGVPLAPFLPKIFLPIPLELSTAFKNKKEQTEYANHKKIKNSQLQFKIYCFLF